MTPLTTMYTADIVILATAVGFMLGFFAALLLMRIMVRGRG